MVIGSVGAGKSTLVNVLLGREKTPMKTQALLYHDWLVDSPGEYTENPMFYKSIMVTSLEVTHVLLLQDSTNTKTIFPPGFTLGLPKLPIGVVTKSDHKNADIERALNQLKKVVIKGPIIITSAIKESGLIQIKELVQCNTLEQMKKYCDTLDETLYHWNS
ncbi:EutP/PduV family microcompartment system protein [Alkalihalobacterium elongatum]|uniref:EutP/PduV family microcompartment system protein n=1 Tax=Alkalihalobacterium elongatum TaxID=2675466 RepID=UPI001C1F8636|nr:EutP/PduV family microcompartment system protein [Alkalihalobacterium elongatum]